MTSEKPLRYHPETILDDGRLVDVRLHFEDKSWRMWGRSGPTRELALAESRPSGTLPVLLGSGLGTALARLLESGPVAVIDRETRLLEATKVRQAFGSHARVLWLDDEDPEAVLQRLAAWRAEHGGRPLAPLPMSLYLRLRPSYYQLLRRRLESAEPAPEQAQAPASGPARPPRPLLLTSQYFLMGEIVAALQRLEVDHRLLDIGGREISAQTFVDQMLAAVREFKPDFVLTVNHLGVDHEGVLMELLDRLRLPLASWFVDDPRLILDVHRNAVHPLATLFTWDADTVAPLQDMGFSRVLHLPLGADPVRFHPGQAGRGRPEWTANVSFVGNSMVEKTARRLEAAAPPPALTDVFTPLAARFALSEHSTVAAFLAAEQPDLLPARQSIPAPVRRLAFDTALIWEATRLYRLDCVRRLAPFAPLVVGDEKWAELLAQEPSFRLLPELSYYSDLPAFYPCSRINFNCTSRQMKGAVNQRVFDVPSSRSFLLTDHSRQLEELFEPGREVAIYNGPEDIPEQVRRWLADPMERERISRAGRRRVLAEHTYDRRLAELLSAMAQSLTRG
jgi:spore maturation protein CgeB